MTDPLEDENWRDRASCRDETIGPEIFYPDKDDHPTIRRAKLICRTCPVSTECLTAAHENGEPFGIWGGYTPEEREIIRVANKLPVRRPPDIFPHGTAAGYARHRRDKSTPCRSCVTAHTVDRREWKQRNATEKAADHAS